MVPTTSTLPYHVTARTVNCEQFPVDLDSTWELMSDYLFRLSMLYEISIHSFVLMPNHFHLLASAPEGNLSKALNFFMGETSRALSAMSGRINQTYGGRNHKSLIETQHYFFNAYKYVYRNPVRAGLCRRCEEYRYSTLSGILGFERLIIPVTEDLILFPDRFDDSALGWLNSEPEPGHEEEIRRALRKARFAFAKRNETPSILERTRF